MDTGMGMDTELDEEVEGAEAGGAVEAAAQQAERGVFGVAPFFIPRGPLPPPRRLPFSMQAPTTAMNLQRVLSGLQQRRPALLEGRCDFVCLSVVALCRFVSSCVSVLVSVRRSCVGIVSLLWPSLSCMRRVCLSWPQ